MRGWVSGATVSDRGGANRSNLPKKSSVVEPANGPKPLLAESTAIFALEQNAAV
jgi:hypothetical protein